MVDALSEAELLARNTLHRLESAESLVDVLPAARRLAELLDRHAEALWLRWELAGFPTDIPPDTDRPAAQIYGRLHLVADFPEQMKQPPAGPPQPTAGKRLIGQPMAILEARTEPPTPSISSGDFEVAMLERAVYHASRVVIARVREAVHRFVTELHRDLARQRSRVELLGVDAPTVFAAGDLLLERLGVAVDDLGWPGREAEACLSVRSALEQIGVALYAGDDQPYTSPATGREYNPTKSETHRLHAILDALLARADNEQRRAALLHAHTLIKEVRDAAGRAKTQPMTRGEALAAVKAGYAVAHAICFAGGFPPRAARPSVAV
jgi:hypothetical protein